MTEQKIRKEISSLITEIREEQKQQEMDALIERLEAPELEKIAQLKEVRKIFNKKQILLENAEAKQLSEVRSHVRNAINEMMVGLTPITRIDTQEDANAAEKGNVTNTGIDKAAIGFNTFDMHEWASIAGITENAELTEHWQDDGYGSNVVDIRDPMSDESHEIPGMISPEQPAPCGGCDEGSCDCHSEQGPVTGDVGHSSEVSSDVEIEFDKFLAMLKAQDDAGATRLPAAAIEGDEHYQDEYADFDVELDHDKPRG